VRLRAAITRRAQRARRRRMGHRRGPRAPRGGEARPRADASAAARACRLHSTFETARATLGWPRPRVTCPRRRRDRTTTPARSLSVPAGEPPHASGACRRISRRSRRARRACRGEQHGRAVGGHREHPRRPARRGEHDRSPPRRESTTPVASAYSVAWLRTVADGGGARGGSRARAPRRRRRCARSRQFSASSSPGSAAHPVRVIDVAGPRRSARAPPRQSALAISVPSSFCQKRSCTRSRRQARPVRARRCR
jgi:hypothetical protein